MLPSRAEIVRTLDGEVFGLQPDEQAVARTLLGLNFVAIRRKQDFEFVGIGLIKLDQLFGPHHTEVISRRPVAQHVLLHQLV